MWGYPYRLGITLFLIFGTALLMGLLLGIAVALEKAFKKEKAGKNG